MAAFLKIPPEDLLDDYVEVMPDGQSLTLISKADHSCILLDGMNKCKVNPAKPDQCSGFPNTWFFEGWQEDCEAILINEEDFDKSVQERDRDLK